MAGNKVNELKTTEEIKSAYHVMKELRSHVSEGQYVDLVEEAMAVDRYHLFALYADEEIVAVTGFKEMTTLYYGRFVWVCDLVTSSEHRSQGYGEELLTFVEDWSREHGMESVALSSGISRLMAHRFYERKMDYDRVSYVFRKSFPEGRDR
ncbi:GNAT family N-acetyltransferase [Halobacillus litoralis]|uniref:GNAT family N-acetyltransferase n=1 Tax=Halobacillus litoralis TaxID=45668 RepID=UPI001CFCF451|nr:GNAT family N-acetyltransferase [Halobacillus litoralis]WLR46449.1 GNAT family N-acetyltransferase [Halobacillus litoralis]